MKLKQLDYDLAVQIDRFWERDWSHYTLPDNKEAIIDAVVVNDDNKAIAYGQVRHFAELMLFEDLSISKRDRVEALRLLMAEGFRGVDKANLKEVYCLIKDMRFAQLIAKHYGFRIVMNPGVLLVRRID